MTELEDYLPFIKSCKVQLQSMGLKCVVITYVVFPADLDEVISYIHDNKDRLEKAEIIIEIPNDTAAVARKVYSYF